jgi:predicted TIM-barrel fold metal-dependent hydrolase
MDTLGIDKALLFPTLFAEYFPVVDNPDVASALARAYNDWIYDFTSGTRDRLIPAMVLPTQDVGFAIQELQRNARRGFKVVSLRPIFYDGKFLNHPMYNPLWEAVEQSGLAVLLYASPGMTNPEWTCEGSFVERVAANLKIGHTVTETCAPLMDNNNAFTCFITNGHYENFPNLKLGYVGSGASWITLSLEKAESFMQLAADLRDVTLEPEEVFLDRAPLVQFDGWETPPARMYDVYGKFAGWGSRYPQHITSTPQEALNTLSKCGVPTDVAAQMMGGNAARFIGL